MRPDVLQIIALVAGSQALSAFSRGNFSIVAKKGMGHWWNDTERENSKYSEKNPYASTNVSSAKLTWTVLRSNPGFSEDIPTIYILW